jgi:hypothetical protein
LLLSDVMSKRHDAGQAARPPTSEAICDLPPGSPDIPERHPRGAR